MTLIQRAPPGIVGAGKGFARTTKSGTDVLRAAWRTVTARWKIVLTVPIALIVLAVAWFLLAPAQYTATARLMIDPGGLRAVAGEAGGTGQAADAGLLVVDNQIGVLTSNAVLGQVVDREHLAADPAFMRPTPLEALVAMVSGIVNGAPPDGRTVAIRKLKAITSAHRIGSGLVIGLSVASPDRALSVRLVNAVMVAYLAADRSAQDESAKAVAARLAALGQAARQADAAVQAFKAAHNMTGSGEAPVSDRQLVDVTAELANAALRTAILQARLAQIESVARGDAGLDSVAEIVQSAAIAGLRSQLAAVKSRLDGLLARGGGDRLPTVVDARAQVATLQSQIADEVQRIAAAARNDAARAHASQAALQARLDRLKSTTARFNADSVQLRALQRQADAARNAYQAFLATSRNGAGGQDGATAVARVISPPLTPAGRDGPDVLAVLAAALVGGLGLGAGGVLIGDRARGRIRSRRRLEQATGHEVLVSLPSLPDVRFESGDAVPENAREIDRVVSLLLARLSGRAHRSGGGPLAVMVTSGDDERNKSAVSLYLALCGTLERRTVLLVDADPRGLVTQAVCGVHGREPEATGETIGGQNVSHVDSFPGLRVISPITNTAVTELVAGGFLGAVEGSDLVVIDAPLIGTAPAVDRLIADERIGAIVFTASAEVSTLAGVRQAVAPIADDSRLMPVLCDEAGGARSG